MRNLSDISRILAAIATGVVILYIDAVLWNIFIAWTETFEWGTVEGNVFYTTGVMFLEAILGILLMIIGVSSILIPYWIFYDD